MVTLSEIIKALQQVAEAKKMAGVEMAKKGYEPSLWYTTPKPSTWSGLLFIYDLWHNQRKNPNFCPPPTGYPIYCRVIYREVRHVRAYVVWECEKLANNPEGTTKE